MHAGMNTRHDEHETAGKQGRISIFNTGGNGKGEEEEEEDNGLLVSYRGHGGRFVLRSGQH